MILYEFFHFYNIIFDIHSNDQLKFAEWLYGKKNRKMCKTDVSLCTGFENAFGASGGRAGNS